MYALLDAIESPIFWRERIESIMGYIPYPELFTVEDREAKQAQIEIAYKPLKDSRPIAEILKVTELAHQEIDFLL